MDSSAGRHDETTTGGGASDPYSIIKDQTLSDQQKIHRLEQMRRDLPPFEESEGPERDDFDRIDKAIAAIRGQDQIEDPGAPGAVDPEDRDGTRRAAGSSSPVDTAPRGRQG